MDKLFLHVSDTMSLMNHCDYCPGLRLYGSRSKSKFVTIYDFRYESGDHVAVFPTNDSALVNKLGQILGVDLDVVISLNNLDGMALKALSTLT